MNSLDINGAWSKVQEWLHRNILLFMVIGLFGWWWYVATQPNPVEELTHALETHKDISEEWQAQRIRDEQFFTDSTRDQISIYQQQEEARIQRIIDEVLALRQAVNRGNPGHVDRGEWKMREELVDYRFNHVSEICALRHEEMEERVKLIEHHFQEKHWGGEHE